MGPQEPPLAAGSTSFSVFGIKLLRFLFTQKIRMDGASADINLQTSWI